MKKCKGIIIHPEELTEQMIGFLAKSNLNVLGIHPILRRWIILKCVQLN